MASVPFDFDLTKKSYTSLMKEFKNFRKTHYSHLIPVTNRNKSNEVGYIDLKIKVRYAAEVYGGTYTIIVKIRLLDYYLVAFRKDGGKWNEIRERGKDPIIDGANVPLHKLNYEKDTLENMKITNMNFVSAIKLLGECFPFRDTEFKDSLFLVVVVICEGARIPALARSISGVIQSPPSKELTLDMFTRAMINNWGKMSSFLLKCDSEGDTGSIPSIVGGLDLENLEEERMRFRCHSRLYASMSLCLMRGLM